MNTTVGMLSAAGLVWLAIGAVAPAGSARSTADTAARSESDTGRSPRAAEVAEISSNIIEIHPEGQRLARNEAFTKAVADLESAADALGLAEYIMRLHRLFSLVDDGHTAVLSTDLQEEPFVLRTPILAQPFADGMYIIQAKDEATPLLGGRVVSVNDTPIDGILEVYVKGAPGDNPAFAMRWSPFLFAFPGWIYGLGFASGPYDAPIAIEVLSQSGETIRAKLRPREGANLGRAPIERKRSLVEEMSATEASPNFVRVLRDKNAAYVSLDAMADTDNKSFADFTTEVRNALADADIRRVVIDLRRNGGGNNMLPEPLRRTLVKSRFNRPGGIYVLIGPRTFSAAMNLATRLERETDALFVGEPTGGRPNHYGDAKFLTGSATGVHYLVSTLRWADSTPFDKRIWLLPDIPAPPTFADYVAGRDAALDAALSHSPVRKTSDEARVVTPWARPSQQAGWQFFFEPESGGLSGPVDQ
ncbi:MAG: S41 family peptidase [Candidatus Krumholzibacteria bacterium]|nr:S41 family peptidase [Candidatus Krumholzibacteria bacterium]